MRVGARDKTRGRERKKERERTDGSRRALGGWEDVMRVGARDSVVCEELGTDGSGAASRFFDQRLYSLAACLPDVRVDPMAACAWAPTPIMIELGWTLLEPFRRSYGSNRGFGRPA